MVEALLRQDEPNADDVAGRRLFFRDELLFNAIKDAGTDEPLKVAAKMREKPIEDFFSRNGKLREDNLMVHDLMLVQVKTPEESKYSVGLLQDPRQDLGRGSVRPDRSSLHDGKEMK